MQKKQLYIAYGSNINLGQMAYRCPHSRVVGTSEIKNFELEFRGVATIVPKENASVPVLIWELDERDLPILNRYEGYPRLYRQEEMPFELDGKSYKGMAYLMNHGEISPPSQQYYNTILQGYRENGLDESYLQKALENSLQMELAEEECDEDFEIDEFEDIDFDDEFEMDF
ncbi:MAG: gamma-glutamylcyclotransferase [Clostridium sp.]|nr:gamma-glutamylcyclotransferase [Clostridium sp.]